MAKLKLNPDPTFKKKVAVPTPTGAADVELTFKYRDRPALQAWLEATKDAPEVDVFLDMVCGWELDDAFDRENVVRLCDAYPGASREAVNTYLRALTGIRSGN